MTGQDVSGIVCFCCGVCCSKYQAQMTLAEVQNIAEKLSLSWQEFADKYLDPRWPGVNTFLARHENGACVFFDWHSDRKFGFCRIHSYKPKPCSDWEANTSKIECRQGLKNLWNLELADDGSVIGSEEIKYRFEKFLDSINQKEK
jgi:Fe-S-cluster containining protein